MPNFTKMAIKNTFIQLLNEKPLSQITVKDIVETCGVNRNSFYYHFQDIPALVEEIVTEEADRIIAEHPSIDSIEECLNAALDFARKNRRAILHIHNSANRDIYEQYLWKVCQHVVSAYVEAAFADQPIRESDRKLLIRFYKCECFGMVMEWLSSGMSDDIADEIKRICDLRKGMAEEMVARSVKGETQKLKINSI